MNEPDDETVGDAYDRGYKQATADWAERCASAEASLRNAQGEAAAVLHEYLHERLRAMTAVGALQPSSPTLAEQLDELEYKGPAEQIVARFGLAQTGRTRSDRPNLANVRNEMQDLRDARAYYKERCERLEAEVAKALEERNAAEARIWDLEKEISQIATICHTGDYDEKEGLLEFLKLADKIYEANRQVVAAQLGCDGSDWLSAPLTAEEQAAADACDELVEKLTERSPIRLPKIARETLRDLAEELADDAGASPEEDWQAQMLSDSVEIRAWLRNTEEPTPPSAEPAGGWSAAPPKFEDDE